MNGVGGLRTRGASLGQSLVRLLRLFERAGSVYGEPGVERPVLALGNVQVGFGQLVRRD
jgi:hypothetical protein